ncbi:YozE family protein [Sphingobium rhizovicinum]|uniref:YozE family protein n=1 Tax=Sphingobium rhizovicinum TaxID=432308 RepID=A0ABV7NNN8_9SPHN
MAMTGDELRAMRVRKRWTQSQLATHLKVTPQYVGMMERGEKDIQSHVEEAARSAMGDPDHPDLYVPDGALYREAQQAVLTALRQHPDLSLNGFRYTGFDKDPFEGAKSEHESRARLFSDDSLAQIATAIRWIDSVKRIKTYKCGSYGAKHRAEKWGKENGLASYVANGALIAAAVHRKVGLRREQNNPNAELALDPDPMPEPKSGTFAHWLHKQVKRNDPVGDLARDAAQDRTFPVDTSSGPKLRSYMRSCWASDAAIDALEEALTEWRGTKTRRVPKPATGL